jgi:hypothetical protein
MMHARTSMLQPSTSSVLLPDYASASADAPSYSSEPLADERRLDFTPRYPDQALRNATITHKGKGLSVVFSEQHEGAVAPTFSQYDMVVGEIGVGEPAKVSQITIQVSLILSSRHDTMTSNKVTHPHSSTHGLPSL